jgi:ankyrin repeat protein
MHSNQYDESNLLEACERGDLMIVSQFLEMGLSANTVGNDGRSALHLAVKSNEAELIRLLLSHGADSCAMDADESTALTQAFLAGNKTMIDILVSHEWNNGKQSAEQAGTFPSFDDW